MRFAGITVRFEHLAVTRQSFAGLFELAERRNGVALAVLQQNGCFTASSRTTVLLTA